MGEAAEGKNIAHGVKKVDSDALRKFRDRFRIPFSDEELEKLPYITFDEDSVEMKYMKARRAELHGFVPQRLEKFTKKLEIPSLAEFESITKDDLEAKNMEFKSQTFEITTLTDKLFSSLIK